MELDQQQLQAARKLSEALRLLTEATKRDIPLQSLLSFLMVAEEEGRSLVELSRAIWAKPSTASRQLLDLAAFDRFGGPGYGLVERGTSPLDPCAASYTLTPKGRRLVDAITALMSDSGAS